MAYLFEKPAWEEGIYQLEENDPVLGGPNGVSNLPQKNLANRTVWLKRELLAAADNRSYAFTAAPGWLRIADVDSSINSSIGIFEVSVYNGDSQQSCIVAAGYVPGKMPILTQLARVSLESASGASLIRVTYTATEAHLEVNVTATFGTLAVKKLGGNGWNLLDPVAGAVPASGETALLTLETAKLVGNVHGTATDIAVGNDDSDLASKRGQLGERHLYAGDLNELLKTGQYIVATGDGTLNAPTEGGSFFLDHYNLDDKNAMQIAWHSTGDQMHYRAKVAGIWTVWRHMITSNNAGHGLDYDSATGVIKSHVYVGASATKAGEDGIITGAPAGAVSKAFLGDGTWGFPSNIAVDGNQTDLATLRGQIGNPFTIAVPADFNKLVSTGNFDLIGEPVNGPVQPVGHLEVLTKDSLITQRHTSNRGNVYTRMSSDSGTTWTAWVKIIASSDLTGITAGKASILETKRSIDGVSFDGSADVNHWALCSTAASDTEKIVALTGFVLAPGAVAHVKFTISNTATNPTLNISGTGAKYIKYRDGVLPSGTLSAGRTYTFVYDGVAWQLDSDLNTDVTVTQSVSTINNEYPLLAAATKNKTATSTEGSVFAAGVTVNPSTNTITANNFIGAVAGNSSSATQLAQARNINGVDFDGTKDITNFAQCTTAGATIEKTASVANFKLVTGATVYVKFTNTNTASGVTLNVTGTGAKSCFYNNSAISPDICPLTAGHLYQFVYDGTQFVTGGECNTVHLTGDETVSGTKTFTNDIYCNSVVHGTQLALNNGTNANINFIANNVANGGFTITGAKAAANTLKPIALEEDVATSLTTAKNYTDGKNGTCVHLAGSETISGEKNFTTTLHAQRLHLNNGGSNLDFYAPNTSAGGFYINGNRVSGGTWKEIALVEDVSSARSWTDNVNGTVWGLNMRPSMNWRDVPANTAVGAEANGYVQAEFNNGGNYDSGIYVNGGQCSTMHNGAYGSGGQHSGGLFFFPVKAGTVYQVNNASAVRYFPVG